MSELLYATDSYIKEWTAHIVDVQGSEVALNATAFFPGGGGQPADTGTISEGERTWRVTGMRREGDTVWHTLDGEPPAIGSEVRCALDWERRYLLMRTHTALHALSAVVFRDFGAKVTGGNMEPGEARMDFELADFTPELAEQIVRRTNEELARGLPVKVYTMPREEALLNPDLIRTKVNLIPESIQVLRIVEIEGLDIQADGGTHVANTAEIGNIVLLKTRSKGANFKRMMIGIADGVKQS